MLLLSLQTPYLRMGAIEGNPVLISHMIRERDPGLRGKKIADVLARIGHLECEGCKTAHETLHGRKAHGMYDVHHRKPISEGQRETKLDDLAVLCASCHRLIHRIAPMMTVEEFAAYYATKISN